MRHLGQLAQLVQFIARNYSRKDLIGMADELGWLEKRGHAYVDLTNTPFLMAIGIPQHHPDDMSVRFMRVTGAVGPLRRKLSDTVALALCEEDCKESAWFDAEEGRWDILHDRDVLVIPKSVGYGFRADEPRHRSLHLLTASSPAITGGGVELIRA